MLKLRLAITAAIAAACLVGVPAIAKDNDKGNDKGNKQSEKAERKADKEDRKADRKADKQADKQEVREGAYFRDEHRQSARRYYVDNYSDGKAKRCPPGLAKKNNGCMPPGQARNWAVGQPLPRGVVVYEVPRPVLVQLPPVPMGYRYERVGGDIVLVRINGRVVMDIMLNIFG